MKVPVTKLIGLFCLDPQKGLFGQIYLLPGFLSPIPLNHAIGVMKVAASRNKHLLITYGGAAADLSSAPQ